MHKWHVAHVHVALVRRTIVWHHHTIVLTRVWLHQTGRRRRHTRCKGIRNWRGWRSRRHSWRRYARSHDTRRHHARGRHARRRHARRHQARRHHARHVHAWTHAGVGSACSIAHCGTRWKPGTTSQFHRLMLQAHDRLH